MACYRNRGGGEKNRDRMTVSPLGGGTTIEQTVGNPAGRLISGEYTMSGSSNRRTSEPADKPKRKAGSIDLSTARQMLPLVRSIGGGGTTCLKK